MPEKSDLNASRQTWEAMNEAAAGMSMRWKSCPPLHQHNDLSKENQAYKCGAKTRIPP
jgi:hypothetical protein